MAEARDQKSASKVLPIQTQVEIAKNPKESTNTVGGFTVYLFCKALLTSPAESPISPHPTESPTPGMVLTASGASKPSAASTTLSSNCRTKLPLQTNQK